MCAEQGTLYINGEASELTTWKGPEPWQLLEEHYVVCYICSYILAWASTRHLFSSLFLKTQKINSLTLAIFTISYIKM